LKKPTKKKVANVKKDSSSNGIAKRISTHFLMH
jgi:hypothetical protein